MKPIDAAWNLLKAIPHDQLFGGAPRNYAEFEEDRPPVDRFGPINPAILGLLRRRMGIDTMKPTVEGEGYPDMRVYGDAIEDVPTIYQRHATDEMFEDYDGARDAHLYDHIFERGN
tara:strand:- start:744 stop:1091 length:348 start_codon:yes stop_codon:yes gene_type:complete